MDPLPGSNFSLAECNLLSPVRPCFQVRIDATTMVPTDLYWSMLRAGRCILKGQRIKHLSFLSPKPIVAMVVGIRDLKH